MKNITPELIAKAKEAKSAEQLLEIAKENGVELTEEEAKTYFAQLGASGAVSDDDLDAVAGGSDCPFGNGKTTNVFKPGNKVKVINGTKCSCGSDIGVVSTAAVGAGNSGFGSSVAFVKCVSCNAVILKDFSMDDVQLL
jgi:predicted ribosomally synthesized peptide with nif11-like leader